MKKRNQRIIEKLRHLFPDGEWSYSHEEHVWKNDTGWTVTPESHHTPMFASDDDTFVTYYRASNTGRLLIQLGGPLIRLSRGG